MAIVGNIKALVQTKQGYILAGTDAQARIYRSTDEGQTWTLVTQLALGTDTGTVNAFVRTNDGRVFAAVTGSTNTQGIWRNDSGDGAGWTRVKTHPLWNGYGYLDITAIQGSRLVAVGYGTNNINDGPIILSNDGGTTWVTAMQPHYGHTFMAVSAAPDMVLPTRQTGDPVGFLPAYYGSNTTYTEAGRAGMSSAFPLQAQAVHTQSGAMGAGGLDMAAYLIKDGAYYTNALWAVKSHLNAGNTEIWRFPASKTGPYNFVKIATISGELFNVLFVDPALTYQSIGSQRTIWAGGNGRIYVSYNSGLSWAVATDAPNGPIYAFTRTASGVLLAGGANGEVFRFTGSGSEGGGGGTGTTTPPVEPPPPTIPDPPVTPTPPEVELTATARFLGRAPTTEEEVYVANKFSFSNVTHVFYDDNIEYVNLQFAQEPPYSLLGATPDVGRMVWFGSRTSDANVPGGPFGGLVFNITYAAKDITVTWQYWNGTTWATLAAMDNTASFTLRGTRSVQWKIPSNWNTTFVNGVTGYWVRARVTAVGSAPVGPVHDMRYIYTPNLPYVEIAEGAIGGTLPALAQILWRNQGDNPNGTPDLETHRLLIGLRSLNRGRAFEGYVNLSDKQMPFGVTITSQNASGAFENSVAAPTNRRYTISYPSGHASLNSWKDLVRVTLSTTIARDYYGDFRVFLRGSIAAGNDNSWRFRLALGVGSGGQLSYSREVAAKPTILDYRIWDLGSVRIPSAALGAEQVSDLLTLTLQGYAISAGTPAKLYDLIFVPLDEWAGDFLHTNLTDSTIGSGVEGGGILDVDSVSNPKTPLSAYNRQSSNLIKAIYQPIANGEAILQEQAQQRLWFLAAQYDFATRSWGAWPTLAGTVRVNKVQQYAALRGKG